MQGSFCISGLLSGLACGSWRKVKYLRPEFPDQPPGNILTLTRENWPITQFTPRSRATRPRLVVSVDFSHACFVDCGRDLFSPAILRRHRVRYRYPRVLLLRWCAPCDWRERQRDARLRAGTASRAAHRRPKYGCRACGTIHQAPAPEQPIAKLRPLLVEGPASNGRGAFCPSACFCRHLACLGTKR
jgi:hypothetical protein